MAIEILMPALSPTMEDGTLAKWLKQEGDAVKAGDIIAEIETDKATMEFEAVDEGILGKILIAEGSQGVKVNTPIAVLVEEGESADDVADRAGADSKPAQVQAPSTAEGPDQGGQREGQHARRGRTDAHQPRAQPVDGGGP